MLLRSIRSRLLGLVVATVVPFTALIGVGLWNQWRTDQAAAIERATNEARLLAAQVDDHIGNLENLLAGLSRAVSTNPADATANDALLRQVKAELPSFINQVVLYDLDGDNIGYSWDAQGQVERGNSRNRDYFQQVLNGANLAISEIFRARTDGAWIITVGRPVKDQAGKLRAVLAVGTRLDHFQDVLRVQALPAGSVVRIVNQDGIVIARTAESVGPIGLDLSKVDNVARHLGAKEMSEVIQWPDGVERITGSSTAHDAPWLVSVGLPTDIALAAVVWRLAWGALFTAATLLIAFLIAWMLSGHIVRPLRQLGKDASALAAGDLSHRTDVRTHDEVGLVAEAFNRMAASLEQRQAEADRAAEEVRQTKDTLAAVIDASPVAIICSDPDRRIFLWNRSAEKIFGYTAEEAMGQAANVLPRKATEEIAGTIPARAARRNTPQSAHQATAQERNPGRRQGRGSADVPSRWHSTRCCAGLRGHHRSSARRGSAGARRSL